MSLISDEVKVSICCITYNHKKFISQAIESFLAQKTNFEYEIIIHDDCSTDGTIDILKYYEKKYPNKIKVIYQLKNLYSKGEKIFPKVFEQAKGKYIAICEGDDYWINPEKLQIQYDFMEENPDYSLMCHEVNLFFEDTKKMKKRPCYYKNSCVCECKDFILNHGIGGLFPTCSMFFRTKFITNIPQFYYESQVEDLPLTLFLGTVGKCYYLNKVMGVYRFNTPNSWTMRRKKNNVEKKINEINGFNNLMIKFNEYNNNIYDKELKLYLMKNEIEKYVVLKKYNEIKNKKFKQLYKIMNSREKIKLFLLRNFPLLFEFLKRLKDGK